MKDFEVSGCFDFPVNWGEATLASHKDGKR